MDLAISFKKTRCDDEDDEDDSNYFTLEFSDNDSEVVSSLCLRDFNRMTSKSRVQYFIDNIYGSNELVGKYFHFQSGGCGHASIKFHENHYDFSSAGGEYGADLTVKVKRTQQNDQVLSSFFEELLPYQKDDKK